MAWEVGTVSPFNAREILMFSTEQNLSHNQWLARTAFVALGKNTVSLPALLARKSSLPDGCYRKPLVFRGITLF
jgi:hypothetical protein